MDGGVSDSRVSKTSSPIQSLIVSERLSQASYLRRSSTSDTTGAVVSEDGSNFGGSTPREVVGLAGVLEKREICCRPISRNSTSSSDGTSAAAPFGALHRKTYHRKHSKRAVIGLGHMHQRVKKEKYLLDKSCGDQSIDAPAEVCLLDNRNRLSLNLPPNLSRTEQTYNITLKVSPEGDNNAESTVEIAKICSGMGGVKLGLCNVCWEKSCDFIFLPCGHVATCRDCGIKLYMCRMVCPICRSKILSINDAYVS